MLPKLAVFTFLFSVLYGVGMVSDFTALKFQLWQILASFASKMACRTRFLRPWGHDYFRRCEINCDEEARRLSMCASWVPKAKALSFVNLWHLILLVLLKCCARAIHYSSVFVKQCRFSVHE